MSSRKTNIRSTFAKTFDELPYVDDIEIEFPYDYYHRAGYTTGLPENCYPEEEDFECQGPSDTEIIRIVTRKYLDAAQQAIKNILHYRDNDLMGEAITNMEVGEDER